MPRGDDGVHLDHLSLDECGERVKVVGLDAVRQVAIIASLTRRARERRGGKNTGRCMQERVRRVHSLYASEKGMCTYSAVNTMATSRRVQRTTGSSNVVKEMVESLTGM